MTSSENSQKPTEMTPLLALSLFQEQPRAKDDDIPLLEITPNEVREAPRAEFPH